ncbi:MAG TPA: class I SAM-dependent methyltransferase [Candidatus Acidoferrales bacterium]|nr:class I SAM-dependent methyltransferase [Candidatus Acidoferrales bacterium]
MSGPGTRTLDRCLACGNANLAHLALRYDWEGTRFPAARCARCGMRFLRVQPVGASLARMYSAEYFIRDFRCGRSDATSFDEAAARAENAGLLDRFERYRGAGRLLEVGCAAGWLLRHAADRGWQVRGVEFSADAVRHARGLGLEIHEGTLADALLPEGAFDLVYLGDVLEHVPDCRADAERIARLLAPGGHLFLRGPITTNSLARSLALGAFGALGRELVLREPPYHLWEFTPRSLAALVRAVGLEVVAMEQAKIAPGSGAPGRAGSGGKRGPARALMAAIDAVNVPITRAFNAFGDRVVMVARRPKSA